MFRTSSFIIAAVITAGLLGGYGLLSALSSPSPQEAPAAQESRELQTLMVELALDMERIDQGLWHEDYRMIEQGARAIAGHPKIPKEQMQLIKKALGSRFKQFVQFDKTVHQTATQVANAAANEQMSEVLENYRQLQQGCMACHAGFRAEVRSALYSSTSAE